MDLQVKDKPEIQEELSYGDWQILARARNDRRCIGGQLFSYSKNGVIYGPMADVKWRDVTKDIKRYIDIIEYYNGHDIKLLGPYLVKRKNKLYYGFIVQWVRELVSGLTG